MPLFNVGPLEYKNTLLDTYNNTMLSPQVLIKSILENQMNQAKLPYVGPQAAADVAYRQAQVPYLNAQTGLTNEQTKWYGPNIQSEIGLRGGQLQEALARIPLLQAQAKNAGIEGQEASLKLNLLKEALSSNPSSTEGLQNSSGGIPGMPGGPSINGLNSPDFKSQLARKLFLGSAVDPYQEAQFNQNLKQYGDSLQNSIIDAKDATQMSNFLDQFISNYRKSQYTGLSGALTPGPLARLIDSPTAEADNAAANMQAVMSKLLASNKLTNQELKFAGNLKLNRNMPKKAVDELYDWFKLKSERIKEEQEFLLNARNIGMDPYLAEVRFNQYDNEFPVYDFQNHKSQRENLGKWRNYLNQGPSLEELDKMVKG